VSSLTGAASSKVLRGAKLNERRNWIKKRLAWADARVASLQRDVARLQRTIAESPPPAPPQPQQQAQQAQGGPMVVAGRRGVGALAAWGWLIPLVLFWRYALISVLIFLRELPGWLGSPAPVIM
jgi:hypothetical protein